MSVILVWCTADDFFSSAQCFEFLSSLLTPTIWYWDGHLACKSLLQFCLKFRGHILPSLLWRCWLDSRKGIRPVKNWVVGVLAWLSVWSEMQTCIWPSWCHCHSLSLASLKSRLVLPFWYRLTRVVTEKGLLNGCVCVCVFRGHILTYSYCWKEVTPKPRK